MPIVAVQFIFIKSMPISDVIYIFSVSIDQSIDSK